MIRCIGPEHGDCDAPMVCVLCDCCEEHCASGGSGLCIDAHDRWLAGGPGLPVVVASAAPAGRPPFAPDRAAAMKAQVLLDQDELAVENGLRRCGGCRGLEDPARPHRHG